MTLVEIKNRLSALKGKGFVPSRRKGPTGVGYTLEQELNLNENNLAIPDIGGRVELKGVRKSSTSMITLFTFNRAVWKLNQKMIIEKYGYLDEKNRQSLYSTVFCGQKNSQNLILDLDKSENKVHLLHNSGVLLGTWSVYTLVGKFITKLERPLIVLADNRISGITGKEEFYFSEAYLLGNPSPNDFLRAFENAQIAIDIRMHIGNTGAVRNHGTALRIRENEMPNLYADRRKIL